MPRLDINALQALLPRRNFLFKHQFTNQVGISYARLAEVLADRDEEVDEKFVRRLCTGLGCERPDIDLGDAPAARSNS